MKEALAVLNLVALVILNYRLYTQKPKIEVHVHNTTHVDGEVSITTKEVNMSNTQNKPHEQQKQQN